MTNAVDMQLFAIFSGVKLQLFADLAKQIFHFFLVVPTLTEIKICCPPRFAPHFFRLRCFGDHAGLCGK